MSKDTTYRVYLSSTLADLEEERKAVFEALTSRACAVKQSYGASENDLIETCRDDVAGCDVYVGIFGLRYGYEPPGDNPKQKSIAELELDEAEAKGLQRFLFLKDGKAKGYSLADIDNPRTKIDALRARIGSGQGPVPFLFSDTESLKLEVTAKIAQFRSRSQPRPLLDNFKPHPAALRWDAGLALVPGTDDVLRAELEPYCGEHRFRPIEASPGDARYLKTLDEGARHCRSLVWVFTPTSLGRFLEKEGLLELAAGRLGPRFGGPVALLCGGLAASRLPAGVFAEIVERGPTENAADCLERCYQILRARSGGLGLEPLIPLPCVVLAPTTHEVEHLCDDSQAALLGYPDADEKAKRAAELEKLSQAVRLQHPDWPRSFYGARREDWRPFGPDRKSIGEMLERAVARFNDESQRSGRERSLLAGHSARIEIRSYSFDEWLDDRCGSRLLMENLRDRGCLVLVDEIALLHPLLRREGDILLGGEQLAVISASPCDPAHTALEKLVGDFSFLRIGSLRERFRDRHDPRCELAVNNAVRFERWLRLAVPEMVATLGQEEAEPGLRRKMSELLVGRIS